MNSNCNQPALSAVFMMYCKCSFVPDDSPPVLELSCPVSSPLPGDAPLEPPVLGIVTGGRRSPGRSCKRQRSSRSGSKSQGEDEAEVGETPSSQPEAIHEVTPLGAPPTLPLVGVGRRTSVLFKKAKNGARITKTKYPPQQNGKASDVKTNGLDNTPASPSSPGVTNITTLPPTPSVSPTPPSPSLHHLRSKSHSSENEIDRLPPAPGECGEDKTDDYVWETFLRCWKVTISFVLLLGLTNGKHTSAEHDDDDDETLK